MAQRLTNVCVRKPIIIGTYAWKMDGATEATGSAGAPPGMDMYRWTVLLRSGDPDHPNEDLGYYIRKVEFHLHQTFALPKRAVEKAPFEISEKGWGEFEMIIRVYFQNTNEKPLDIKHWVRLRKKAASASDHVDDAQSGDDGKYPIIYESYDEIRFQNPHEWFYEKLIAGSSGGPLVKPSIPLHFLHKYDDREVYQKIVDASKGVEQEVARLCDSFGTLDGNYRALRDLLVRCEVASSLPNLQSLNEGHGNRSIVSDYRAGPYHSPPALDSPSAGAKACSPSSDSSDFRKKE